MTRIFNEHEITIETLDAHIRDSGLVPYKVDPDGIRLRSPQGLGFRIAIIEGKKFIQFGTYLPLRRDASLEDKRDLARRLNEGVFLPTFCIDPDEDLTVAYAMPFTGGLVAAALMSVVNRFGSMLEYVVQNFNEDRLIDFGSPGTVASVTEAGSGAANGELLH